MLVEGMTEKLTLPFVFRALGHDADREEISIVECGGKPNMPLFVRDLQAAGVPYVVVHDRDAPAGREPIEAELKLNAQIPQSPGAARVVVLTPDFEGVAGLRGHSAQARARMARVLGQRRRLRRSSASRSSASGPPQSRSPGPGIRRASFAFVHLTGELLACAYDFLAGFRPTRALCSAHDENAPATGGGIGESPDLHPASEEVCAELRRPAGSPRGIDGWRR